MKKFRLNPKIFEKQFKQEKVKDVFDSVASKYDIMNDLMSVGIHRKWKKQLIDQITKRSLGNLIDVGAGTCDISINYLKKGGKHAFAIDINESMLNEGKNNALDKGLVDNIDFKVASAEELPFEDNTFDAYVTSFCIRNVTNMENAIKEAFRVLKPNGYFYCLEFSHINPLLAKPYDLWSYKVIPEIGEKITKNREAYEYLVESIRRFPKQDDFVKMIENQGFVDVSYNNLSFGIACIHKARKI